MDRQHKRQSKIGLNMVSLMDIFTILVFFLLVNSSDVQLSPSDKINLPESKANQVPEETLVVTVNGENILVQGRLITTVPDVLVLKGNIIPALKEELEFQAGNSLIQLTPEELAAGRPITIMGDKNIPYQLLKKIMVTCTRVNYSNISLAVLKKAESNG